MDWTTLVRWAGYIGILGVTGAAGADVVLRRASGLSSATRERAFSRAVKLGSWACVLVVFATLGRLVTQVVAVAEPSDPFATALAAVLGSRWGTRWLVQVGAAVGAVALLGLARRARRGGTLGPAAMLLAYSLPLTGHAMEFAWGAVVGVLLQGTHVIATAWWLGSLAVLVVTATGVVRPAAAEDRRRDVLSLVTAFSPMALVAASVTSLAGLALGINNIRSIDGLFHSDYGLWLLRKLVIVGGTAVTGAYNWKRVLPALSREDVSPRLWRSATIEVTLAFVVLLFTAFLSTTDAPGIP